jgi:hypothetical protein
MNAIDSMSSTDAINAMDAIDATNATDAVRHERNDAMKLVILAGGLGTGLSEETDFRPKPKVEIGGRPILWYIMKIYSAHGIDDLQIPRGRFAQSPPRFS